MPKPYFERPESKIAEIIRVDHAGEYGARQIYRGQIHATQDKAIKKELNTMLEQEIKHLEYFNQQIIKNKVRPTIMLPIWHLGGYLMGLISASLGTKQAMLVTEVVEDVIDEHYQSQQKYLSEHNLETELQNKIEIFRNEELHHKNIAINHDSQKATLSPIIGSLIRTICRGAIGISKRF